VHGKVSEWTENCTTTDYRGAPPGQAGLGVTVCAQRVHRGGSWNIGEPDRLRLSDRNGSALGSRDEVIGMRVVREVG
jgi:formylglycine-generating enzyme required for sulfatase activity